jgi:hypothetical protein
MVHEFTWWDLVPLEKKSKRINTSSLNPSPVPFSKYFWPHQQHNDENNERDDNPCVFLHQSGSIKSHSQNNIDDQINRKVES